MTPPTQRTVEIENIIEAMRHRTTDDSHIDTLNSILDGLRKEVEDLEACNRALKKGHDILITELRQQLEETERQLKLERNGYDLLDRQLAEKEKNLKRIMKLHPYRADGDGVTQEDWDSVQSKLSLAVSGLEKIIAEGVAFESEFEYAKQLLTTLKG
jgi:chromosome segregation ATPase